MFLFLYSSFCLQHDLLFHNGYNFFTVSKAAFLFFNDVVVIQSSNPCSVVFGSSNRTSNVHMPVLIWQNIPRTNFTHVLCWWRLIVMRCLCKLHVIKLIETRYLMLEWSVHGYGTVRPQRFVQFAHQGIGIRLLYLLKSPTTSDIMKRCWTAFSIYWCKSFLYSTNDAIVGHRPILQILPASITWNVNFAVVKLDSDADGQNFGCFSIIENMGRNHVCARNLKTLTSKCLVNE